MPTFPRLLRNPRVLLGALGVALLLAVALRPRAVPADVAGLSRGPLVVTLDEEGETRVKRRFLVAAPVAGRLLRIDLLPGDRVEGGRTVLATIFPADPTPLDERSRAEAAAALAAARSTHERARAEIARAEAAATLAAAQLARTRQLAAQGIAAADALDASEAEARATAEAKRAADFAAAAAAHQVEAARARLAQASGSGSGAPLQVVAPVTGVVLKRLRESEGSVAPGQPLLELGDPADLEIVADYLSTDAVRLRAGQAARIERWGGGAPLAGVVRRVEPSGFTKVSALGVEEQRVNVLVDFTGPLAARDTLGDGYRVEVAAVVAERADAVKLPVSALFRLGDDWAVFAVEQGRARRRVVTIGERNPLEAELLSGLPADAEVVLHPSDTLDDGSRIERR